MGIEKKNDGHYIYYYEDKFSQEDLDERRLFLNEVVDSSTVDQIAYHILRYNKLDKGIPKQDRKPILLYINSPGGSLVDGFSIIDVILNSITPVYTINLAFSASMAFLIFIAGHKRYTLKHGEFLMHEGTTWGFGEMNKVKDKIEFETKQIESMVKDYVLNQTTITPELYEKNERVEWYMLADEAKKYGIAQFIIGDDCGIEEII